MIRIRWVWAFLIMLISLAVFFGGWSLYRTFGLMHPLQSQLKSNPAVAAVSFQITGKTRTVNITLNKVDDLRSTFEKLSSDIKDSLGVDSVIQIDTHSSNQLKQLYATYEPIVYEGLAKKDYTEMIQRLETKGKQDGLTVCRVGMDRQNVYIQMEKGADYLYEVVPYDGSLPNGSALPASSGVGTGVSA